MEYMEDYRLNEVLAFMFELMKEHYPKIKETGNYFRKCFKPRQIIVKRQTATEEKSTKPFGYP
jgi:flavodoxin